jgi:septal ring factor EnvC (AmiA/AmiB activator)
VRHVVSRRAVGRALAAAVMLMASRRVAAQSPATPPAQPPTETRDARPPREALERARQERAALERRMRELRTSAFDLRSEVENLDRQADATARLVSALDRQLATIDGEVGAATLRLARAEAELADRQRGLRGRLVEIYKRGPLYEVEALLSAASFGELVARYKYLHELARRDRALVRRVEGLRNAVAGDRALLVRLQGELARNRAEKAVEEQRLRALEGSRGRNLAQVQAQARTAEQRLAQLARDEQRLTGLIAAAEEARRRAAARADARPAPPSTMRRPGAAGAAGGPVVGGLDWPVSGRLLYRFGRVTGANRTTTRWNGIGIAAPAGTPVRAAAPGEVVVAEAIGAFGVTVIVQHGAGDYSVYGSLARADVRRGQRVAKGQPVGTVGAADPDLPPHLHFEVRPQGRAVDPLTWLRGPR